MLKMGEMEHFGAPKQHVWTPFWFYRFDFSRILPDERHQKVDKSDSFGYLRKSLIFSKVG